MVIHVYAGPTFVGGGPANVSRPDLAFLGFGDAHGYEITLPAPAGAQLCAYALNVGAGANTLLGCRTVPQASLPSPRAHPPGEQSEVRRDGGWYERA